MLWLILLALIAVLLFVMFHKPPVNMAGAAWTPPPGVRPTQPEARADADELMTSSVPAQMPETFNFNDLFAAPPRGDQPTNRPSA